VEKERLTIFHPNCGMEGERKDHKNHKFAHSGERERIVEPPNSPVDFISLKI